MIRMFRSVIERVKAMFVLDAMLDLEQQFASRQAERRAALVRDANRYQKEGLTTIAADLHRQAHELSEERPLQTVALFLDGETEKEHRPAELPGSSGARSRRKSNPRPAVLSDSKAQQ